MSVVNVTYLELLHEVCLQRGYALLLTAQHTPPAFAARSSTTLRNLDVVQPYPNIASVPTRRARLTAGEIVVRCRLDMVDGDLEAAAELLVDLLAQVQQRRAA